MATTAPMFLELEQEERERELEQLDQQIQEEKSVADKNHSLALESYKLKTRDQLGKKLLLAAEKNRLIDLVKYIHDDSSLIYYKDGDGYTALHRASYSGHVDIIKYLCRHQADIEAKTSDDWHPLHCAVRWNNVDAAQTLIDFGADVNAESVGGNTPLHIVASNGRYSLTCDIIQMLLYHPICKYLVKNQSGDTAYDIAKRSGPFYRLWIGVMTLFPDEIDPEE